MYFRYSIFDDDDYGYEDFVVPYRETVKIMCCIVADEINIHKYNIRYGQIFFSEKEFKISAEHNPLKFITDHDFIVEEIVVQYYDPREKTRIGGILLDLKFNEESRVYQNAKNIIYKCQIVVGIKNDLVHTFGLILPDNKKI